MLSQRISIAQDFVNEFGLSDEIQLVVDDLRSREHDCAQHDNPVDKAYAMWPTRFYVVRSGVVAFKAEPTVRRTIAALLPMTFGSERELRLQAEHEYKLEELAAFLHASC